MMLLVLVHLFVVLSFSAESLGIANQNLTTANQTNLTIMFITSFGQFGFNSSGAVPAADLALKHINSSPNILPGYNLVYDQVRDSQCHQGRSLDAFFNGILSKPVKLAIVGCGCSVATEPVAEISHRWNISQISYASGLAALSDRYRFLRYFRNSPTFEIVSPSLRSMVDHFRWNRIALLTQDESLFTGAEASIRRELESNGITVVSHMFKTTSDPVTTIEDLFFLEDDFRVFLLNCYSGPALTIICEAAKRGLKYPRYTWIAYDWYPREWWKLTSGSDYNGDCDTEMLEQFLERAISLRRYPAPDNSSVVTDAGISPMKFEDDYMNRARAGGYDIVDAGVRVYDVMWLLAVALNNTMTMVENEDITDTNCNEVPGSLVQLDQFDYTNQKMGCLIQWNLQNTNFSGSSGHIIFDKNGTRIHHIVRLRQYLFDESGKLIRYTFAHLDQLENFAFKFESGFDDATVYPDGVPLDGSAMMEINTFEIELVTIFYFLATLGMLFAIGCLLFNFIFRKRKVVKLSSPGINYFIVAGAVLMYCSIYFYLLPTTDRDVVQTQCILQHWLFTIGYSLAFGAVLAKMWRVYQIFNNPTPKKKILKDRHLVLITFSATAVAVTLLIIETAVPHLRGKVSQKLDQEIPTGLSKMFGIREEFSILVCYEASSPTFFWQIFIFAYLAVLQIVGIVLSFQTRKVKVQGLSDSKFVAAIIHISSIVLVVLALVTFSLRTFINIGNGIFVSGIFILTTIFLALIFIPKMILLYKDPEGKSVFERRPSAVPSSSTGDKALMIQVKTDLEMQVVTLKRLLKERDDIIAEMKQDVAGNECEVKDKTGEDLCDVTVAELKDSQTSTNLDSIPEIVAV